MHKGTVDVKMFNNSFKSICHLTQSNYLIQVRELWELMEQVSEKNMLLLNSIKCLQLRWLYSTGRLLWFNDFLKLIIRTSYNIENTSNMEK